MHAKLYYVLHTHCDGVCIPDPELGRNKREKAVFCITEAHSTDNEKTKKLKDTRGFLNVKMCIQSSPFRERKALFSSETAQTPPDKTKDINHPS